MLICQPHCHICPLDANPQEVLLKWEDNCHSSSILRCTYFPFKQLWNFNISHSLCHLTLIFFLWDGASQSVTSHLRFNEMWQMILVIELRKFILFMFFPVWPCLYMLNNSMPVLLCNQELPPHLPPQRVSEASFCFCRFLLTDYRWIFHPQISNDKRCGGPFLPSPSFPFI